MPHPVKSPKKLIEVALPLDIINVAASREKSIRHGHPSTLHLWWARRPLAAARAVIFSQLVNDPSWKWEMEHPSEVPPGNLKASWASSRKRLFKIIEDLVQWENTANEEVLEKAREEIRKSWRETCELNKDHPEAMELFNPDKLPALHDPFAGGGAIPLEAQRLGLEAYASDLNPVAVLINKAMIEIPPKFAGRPPVGPVPDDEVSTGNKQDLGQEFNKGWPGATGLAEDVRRYGKWMRDEAQKRIGHLYPPVEITKEMAKDRPDLKQLVGQKLTVIAWIWARTVKSPNPAFSHVDVPLASTFILSRKLGKEAYVEPVVKGDTYQFIVKVGKAPEKANNGTKSGGSGSPFMCLMSKTPMDFPYLREEAKHGRMSNKLMAIVAEGEHGRVYLDPLSDMETIALKSNPEWKPETLLPEKALGFRVQEYGMLKWSDLFTSRQLVALTTFSDLVTEACLKCEQDAISVDMAAVGPGLDAGGMGAKAYAEAVSVYLAFALDRLLQQCSTLSIWSNNPAHELVVNLFARQALAMTWDFGEINPFCSAASWDKVIFFLLKALNGLSPGSKIKQAHVFQLGAQNQNLTKMKVISTDPPYYDNIGYADLSDFFYVWLRHSLKTVFPHLFSTISTPKSDELIASQFRHASKEKAEIFFLDGMKQVFKNISQNAHPEAIVTIYYSFKQTEGINESGIVNTGWETILNAICISGLMITGTWPIRSEKPGRMLAQKSNALASCIILACRNRPQNAPSTSRREFIRELNAELPEALDEMTRGAGDKSSPVAPVDLSQAIIGPGMAIFSKYAAVLEADGSPMNVRSALQLINRFLAGDEFDDDTQFCLQWFEQQGWKEGLFGEADVLARSKSTSVAGIVEAGVLESGGGKARLMKWKEYPSDWDPEKDLRMPVWEALHQLIRVFKNDGETAAGRLLARIRNKTASCRQLAYRLYTLCERKGWAEDARAYNEVVTAWPAIEASIKEQIPGELGFDEGAKK